MTRRLFIDLDGVLADFDRGHERLFGTCPLRDGPRKDREIMWGRIRATPGFFANLPEMPGAQQLWNFASRNGAIILSGASDRNPNVYGEKRKWVRKHLGEKAPIIVCPSDEKCLYARPGDVLLDDWDKYRLLWQEVGGVWVTYKDMPQAITDLRHLGFD